MQTVPTTVNSGLASDYVARLYYYLLGAGRESDTASIDFWTQKLTKREMSASGVAAAIAATACSAPVTIRGAEAVRKSYPDFWDEYQRLGGVFHVL